jgi:hypothetical protein
LVSLVFVADRILFNGVGANMFIYGHKTTFSTYNDRVEIEVAKGK